MAMRAVPLDCKPMKPLYVYRKELAWPWAQKNCIRTLMLYCHLICYCCYFVVAVNLVCSPLWSCVVLHAHLNRLHLLLTPTLREDLSVLLKQVRVPRPLCVYHRWRLMLRLRLLPLFL